MDPDLIPHLLIPRLLIGALVRIPKPARVLELALWWIIALAVTTRFWVLFFSHNIAFALIESYKSLLISTMIFLFPLIFRLTFDAMPLEALRAWLDAPSYIKNRHKRLEIPGSITTGLPTDLTLRLHSPEEMLVVLARESKYLSEKIYTRAGVYLLVGVLMALTGLVFFYIQSLPLTTDNIEMPQLLARLAPRVGILFFIQLVAFFFLRQYRIAMDEFRYFEAIKRNREDNLALILLTTKKCDNVDIYKAIQSCTFNVHIDRIAAGETTELLEARKLTKDELAIFEKIVDILAKPKS